MAVRRLQAAFLTRRHLEKSTCLQLCWKGRQAHYRWPAPRILRARLLSTLQTRFFSKGAPPRLAAGHNDSGGETVQRLLPDGRVVNAFNIIGNAH
jgi:hypothetical protein